MSDETTGKTTTQRSARAAKPRLATHLQLAATERVLPIPRVNLASPSRGMPCACALVNVCTTSAAVRVGAI